MMRIDIGIDLYSFRVHICFMSVVEGVVEVEVVVPAETAEMSEANEASVPTRTCVGVSTVTAVGGMTWTAPKVTEGPFVLALLEAEAGTGTGTETDTAAPPPTAASAPPSPPPLPLLIPNSGLTGSGSVGAVTSEEAMSGWLGGLRVEGRRIHVTRSRPAVDAVKCPDFSLQLISRLLPSNCCRSRSKNEYDDWIKVKIRVRDRAGLASTSRRLAGRPINRTTTASDLSCDTRTRSEPMLLKTNGKEKNLI